MLQFYVKDSYVQYSFPASTNVGQSFAIIWSMWRHTLEAKAHKPQVREEKSSVRLFIKVLIIVQLAPEQYRSTYMGIFFFFSKYMPLYYTICSWLNLWVWNLRIVD